MLDATLKAQLQQYLALLRRPIRLVASLDEGPACAAMRELLQAIAGLGEQIMLDLNGRDARRPSFALERGDGSQHLRFAGLPLGHEFTSLVLALLWSGGHPPKVDPARIAEIRAIDRDLAFEVFMSQLSRCRSGACADGRDQSPDPDRGDRGRRFPRGGRGPRHHGGAFDLSERRALWIGTHDARGHPRAARQRAGRARA
jgi:hypothetical protein